MEKKNGSGEKWGGRSLNAYTHFSLFQLPRTSQRGSLISFFWQLKRPFPTRKIDLIWFDYIRINIRSKRIWVGGSGIGLGYRDWEPEWVEIAITILRSTSAFVPLERRRFDSATSRLRLLVTAPSTATIARPINPSDSRFGDSSLLFIYLFFLNSPLFGCWENLKEGRKFIRLKNCWIWLRYCLHGFDDGQNQDSNFGGLKCKDFYFILFIL